MAERYNGWYNYNVWNVMLYIANEYDVYQAEMKLFDDYYNKKISKRLFEAGINRIGRMAHMRSDIKNERLTSKEIAEIRKGIKREYKEHAEYLRSKG